MSTQRSIQAITLCSVATELYDACKALKEAWDKGEDYNEVKWEDLTLAVGLAEAAIENVEKLTASQYFVVMKDHRDEETDEPLFWSACNQWVSLHDADVFVLDKAVELRELLIARFPTEAWRFVEMPACRRVVSLP